MNFSHRLYLPILLAFTVTFTYGAGSTETDSLKKLLSNHMSDTTRMKILFAIVESSSDETEWPIYNEEAFQIAKRLLVQPDSALHLIGMRGMGDAMNNKGYLADTKGDQDAALENYQQSILYRQESGDQRGLAEAYNNFASVYGKRGDVLKSLEYHQKSLKIREQIKDKFGIAQSLNNIGYIYKEQGDERNAFDYFNRSVAIKESIGDKKGIANTYNNIGLIFLESKKLDTALLYFNKSLTIRKEIGHKWGIANSLNNIGLLYLKQNELDSALSCTEQSLAIREKINDKEGISFSLRYLGEIYFKKRDLVKALELSERSLSLAKEAGYAENIKFSSQLLYSIYKEKGDYKNALNMHELFKRMQDSLNNENTKKEAVRSQFKYEYEEKEAVLKADEIKKEELSEKESEKQRLIRNSLVAGVTLLILLSSIIYWAYNSKKKANATIAMQKDIVEEKQKQMLDSIRYAKRIQESLLPTEKYIERNMNRMKNK